MSRSAAVDQSEDVVPGAAAEAPSARWLLAGGALICTLGLLMGRWHPFPWDQAIDTSFGLGMGLSYITKHSPVELIEDEDAQRLLGALAFEITMGLPQYPQWDMLLRVHHRSGLWGVIGDGSSNYITGGFRYNF